MPLMLAVLNDCNILCVNIHNDYLNKNIKEEVYFEAGEDFGTRRGQTVVIVCVLYGLNTARSAWESAMISLMRDLGFTP